MQVIRANYSLKVLLIAAASMTVLALVSFLPARTLAGRNDGKHIQVRISLPKQDFGVGETIPLGVEIWNVGEDTLFIPRKITRMGGSMSRLDLEVQDSAGRYSPGMYGHRDPVPPGKQSLVKAVAQDWVALAPGYFYGTVSEIYVEDFEFLQKPGTYHMQGTYLSHGMDAPLYYNPLAYRAEEVGTLPYRYWKGEIRTNSLEITIAPETKCRPSTKAS
jgi:hypothetical protein